MKRNNPGRDRKTYSARAGRSDVKNHAKRKTRPWFMLLPDPLGRGEREVDPSTLGLVRKRLEGDFNFTAWSVGETGKTMWLARGSDSEYGTKLRMSDHVWRQGEVWRVFEAETMCPHGSQCPTLTGGHWVSQNVHIATHVEGWCHRVVERPLGWRFVRELRH